MNDFDAKMDKWLNEVANRCNELASNKDLNYDFYVFQSSVSFRPKLMIIGANPGGETEYSAKRSKNDLGENENTFIKYYNDSGWRRLQPLYDMFRDNGTLEEHFRNAVITNLSYFNSGTFNALKNKMRIVGSEPLTFCLNKNIELITKIIMPQNLILMGAPARNNFMKFLDNKSLETILPNENEPGVPLIKKSSITYNDENGMEIKTPVYFIEHPSAWNGLNNKENIKLKKDKFKEILCK